MWQTQLVHLVQGRAERGKPAAQAAIADLEHGVMTGIEHIPGGALDAL